jgi:predicted RNase H-like HicB family nuclease
MKIKILIHKEEDGCWAEAPSILGCVSQGDTYEELVENMKEAIEGCLSIDMEEVELIENTEVLELMI